jgi:ubiquinone/menaquinone biosynthesis C-methylase UbiE
MKHASFDHIAATYDTSFTNTQIGKLQRKLVWSYIEKIIPDLTGTEILELNCGTGEDAVLFSERGFNVIATDISVEMLKVTEKKAEQFSMQQKVNVKYVDLESFDETLFDKKFDLVFSNFGGLNCVRPDALKKLIKKLPAILNLHGRFIAVVMPKYCLWESLYFILKFRFTKAFRRWTNDEVEANLKGTTTRAWYYNPAIIRDLSKEILAVIDYRPVGLALPPSYMEKFFESRTKTLTRLNSLEIKLATFSSLSKFADHFLIDLKRL